MVQRLLASLACCGLLALAGCSDDSSSAGPDPSPTAESSSPSPSPTDTQDSETPEEFVRAWVDLSNEMQNSGETENYRAISSRCRPCIAVADQVESYFAAGGHVRTDGWDIRTIEISAAGPKDQVTATVDVDVAPTEYLEAAGGDVKHLDGGHVVELLTLEPEKESWAVIDLEQQAQ
jgi:hypothetical protein